MNRSSASDAGTPGMPSFVISETLFQPIICHSFVSSGSIHAL